MANQKKINKHKAWEMAVRKARQYVNNYDKVRWLIVDLALEVCDISLGGHRSNSIFTVQKFSDEIEINSHTIYEWIRTKRLVLDKLPKYINEKKHNLPYGHFRDVINRVDQNTSKKEVLDIYMEIAEMNPARRKFKKYHKVVSSVLYNAQRPILMADVDLEDIEKMISQMTLVVSLLKKELELRNKYGGSIRDKKERLNMKKEVQNRIDEAG